MEEFDLHKVYVRVTGGFAEYQGGANFLHGKRKCPECLQKMVREPIGQPFIRTDGGCILVNTMGTTGRMIVSSIEPDYHWICTYCDHTISVERKVPLPIVGVQDETAELVNI